MQLTVIYDVPTWLRCVTAFGSGAALTLVYVAKAQLGPNWSIRPQMPRFIVRDGLYRYLRHPMYVFHCVFITLLLLTLGLITVIPALLLILIPIQATRASAESRLIEMARKPYPYY